MNLLDNVGLLAGSEKFLKGILTQQSSNPKFQVQNTALLSAWSNYSFRNAFSSPEIWGRHVESAVGAHLLNTSKSSGLKLSNWRDGNFEVDFILEYKNKIIGLEIKSGVSKIASGMNRFNSQFNPHKMCLISENGLSWKEFLGINPLELF